MKGNAGRRRPRRSRKKDQRVRLAIKGMLYAALFVCGIGLLYAYGDLPRKEVPGYETVTFKTLGNYEYDVFDEERIKKGLNRIPGSVMALDGRKVAITGYMLPMDEFQGRVTKFLLLSNTMACCFGMSPNINEWIEVEMPKGKHTKIYNDEPIVVCGVLQVGEIVRNGEVESLYGMTADSVGLV